MAVVISNILEEKIKLRYNERYMSAGSNEKATAVPSGCYRGFVPVPGGTNTIIRLDIDPLSLEMDEDSFAIYSDHDAAGEAWSVSVRESAAVDIELSATSLLPIPSGVTYLYVYLLADYTVLNDTAATYNVSDEDPRNELSSNYDRNSVVVGRIPVTPLSATLDSWDMSIVSTWDDVMAARTTPQPASYKERTSFGKGDKYYGLVSGIERWSIPTIDHKEAMAKSSSPSSSNPFSTVDQSANMLVAEQQEYYISSVTSAIYVEIPDANKVYIGGDVNSGGGDGYRNYFDVLHRSVVVTHYVNGCALMGSDGGRIGIGNICEYGTSTIANSASADANGFMDGARIYLDFSETVDTEYSGAMIVRYGKGVAIKDLDQTPAQALAVAGRRPMVHGSDVVPRQMGKPSYSGYQPTLQDQVDEIADVNAGTLPRDYSNSDFLMRAYYRGKDDAQMYSSNNKFTLSSGTSVTYRMIGAGPYPLTLWGGSKVLSRKCMFVVSGATDVRIIDLSDMSLVLTKDCGSDLGNAVTTGEGSSGVWKIYDGCMDEDYMYLRAFESTGTLRHCVYVVNLWNLEAATKWGSNPYTLLSGTGDIPDSSFNDMGAGYSFSIINASDTLLATNNPHLAVEDSLRTTAAIQTLNRATGAIEDSGCGSLDGTAPSPSYACGAMCSDGGNIAFGAYRLSSTQNTAHSCDMTDLTANNSILVANISGFAHPNCRSIIYDGVNFWIALGESLYAYNTVDDQLEKGFDAYEGSLFNDGWIGSMDFDGKNIWYVSYLRYVTGSYIRVDLSRFPAGKSQRLSSSTGGAEDVVESSHSIIARSELTSYTSPPEANELKEVLFDGRDVWVNTGQSDGSPPQGEGRRLCDAKFR